MAKKRRKSKPTCKECGGPRGSKVTEATCCKDHCMWCECGRWRGSRMCCTHCAELDGLSGSNSWTFFEILQLLRAADAPMTIREICYETHRQREAVGRTLDKMEQKGLVKHRAVGQRTTNRGQILYWSAAV